MMGKIARHLRQTSRAAEGGDIACVKTIRAALPRAERALRKRGQGGLRTLGQLVRFV
jgi:hypothetical protein